MEQPKTYKIPFNRPMIVGKELYYIAQTILGGQSSATENLPRNATAFLSKGWGFRKFYLRPPARMR
jgi:hypothetical protein